MTTTSQPLLDRAQGVLDGTVHVPEGVVVRAAAFLARHAFEDAMTALCRASGVAIDRASMRSKVIVTRMLHGNETGDRAAVAWAGLCRACHHHAYELVPAADEVSRWLGLVADLIPSDAQIEAGGGEASSMR
jgi:hypothetical protein